MTAEPSQNLDLVSKLPSIKEQFGKQFDPEVVQAFLEVYDIIAAIEGKYQEQPQPAVPGFPA
jgi:response regulator RpfG family c-di-GMP phosphodiesterase